ncbi:MAG: hypothetical protein E7449_06365 [Ruminococcaceae bacterium]|nr:hypothetical protein [Oscillospiraceae bacterium]
MKRLYAKISNLSTWARHCLQAGLSCSAFILWLGCLILLRAGALQSTNISAHLLAREMQSISVGVLMVSVILTCFLEEHLGT